MQLSMEQLKTPRLFYLGALTPFQQSLIQTFQIFKLYKHGSGLNQHLLWLNYKAVILICCNNRISLWWSYLLRMDEEPIWNSTSLMLSKWKTVITSSLLMIEMIGLKSESEITLELLLHLCRVYSFGSHNLRGNINLMRSFNKLEKINWRNLLVIIRIIDLNFI